MSGHKRPEVGRKTSGHLEVSEHTHSHRHRGELYMVGLEQTGLSGGTNYDFVFRNPSGSGKVVEVLRISADSDSSGTITPYKEFAWSGGSGMDVFNYDTRYSDSLDSDVGYGVDLISGGVVLTPLKRELDKKDSGISADANDYLMAGGEVVGFRVVLDSSGFIRFGVDVAEYEP